jgi:SAM-dependent methyltransferase
MTEGYSSAARSPLLEMILRCCGEPAPPGVALMRLAMAAESEAALIDALREAADAAAQLDAPAHERVAALRALARTPGVWSLVRAILAEVSHEPSGAAPLRQRLADLSTAFDRAAAISPEASVALYALGRADLLEAATSEIVDYMRCAGLLGRRRVLLDIGCGIGRFETALAGEMGKIIGTDISPAMIEIARARCATCANVELRLSRGEDLSDIGADQIDCVMAVDSFPYIVSAADSLPGRMLDEIARVLKRGGDLLIINYSYRQDPFADAADMALFAQRSSFVASRSDERPFGAWDGRVFHFRKQG